MIRRSLILDTLVDVIVRTALIFALFLLFTGHNAPGGGFVAGLVAGATLILRFVAGGRDEVRRLLRFPPEVIMAAGLTLAVITGILGLTWGTSFLESAKFETVVPVLGTVKATSALPFDIGVFTVVVGLTGALVQALGGEDET